ncbi:MAG: glycosyltransferase family 4 protein [Gammaproteobacteria bacterium]|nr:glycosyltransferase family 4 protein [Gammaproteobacteria bacterium]
MKIWMACETLVEGCAPNVTVLEIRNSLKKQNNQVLLFCPATQRHYARPEDSDIYFVPTLNIRWLREITYQFFLALSMLFLCLKSRPNWIYTRPVITMVSPALVAKVFRIPHLLHPSGDPLDQLREQNAGCFLTSLYVVIERVNCKLSHRVIVETYNNKVNYEKRHRLPAERVLAIPNGANTDLFKPRDLQQARSELGIESDCLCVGFVGNLSAEEGVEYLIEAATVILREIPKARFLIVGDGPVKEDLMEIARMSATPDRFTFAGRVPYEAVPVYMAAMDVCVVPRNRARYERTGISSLKLREYFSCERPVVGSDIAGVGDVLREANAGIAVTPENTPEFAEAIAGLLRDKALREEMGKNGRRFVLENLSWDVSTRRLVEAYESAAARRQK